MNNRNPHVMVIGLRGFPGIQGGVETHAQNLFPLIAAAGFNVTVALRSPYVGSKHLTEWQGVRFVKIWSPLSRSLEAITHTFLAVLYAAFHRPDILHIQAIGPALLTPLARLFCLKVIVTHHGADYERQKWGAVARNLLRCGEASGMRCAHKRIAVSRTIQAHVKEKYGMDAAYIPNGVALHPVPAGYDALQKFQLEPGRYMLMVARLVPEKRQIDCIQAFQKAGLPGWKLVLVGGADHVSDYSRSVDELAVKTPNVLAIGVQHGRALHELYAHAGFFIQPSSHEGLPISLLEALSYGLSTLASDIPPHREIELPPEHYFKIGDVNALAEGMKRMSAHPKTIGERDELKQWVAARYNWPASADKTVKLYRALLEPVHA